MLTKYSKEFTKDDVKKVACYNWDQVKYDPTAETFSEFLKCLKNIAKQAFQEKAVQYIQTFLIGMLPISIQEQQQGCC